MTRDRDALHVGQTVQTPNGIDIIRRRVNGPIIKWVVNDFPWPESKLSIVAAAVPTGISRPCKRGDHHACGRGFIDAGTMTECVCRCGHVEGRTGAAQ